MKWFTNCKTLSDVKSLYKELAKQHHPDRGGNTQIMQEINNEYTFACAKAAKTENSTAEEVNEKIEEAEAYKAAINKIINLEGIIIEVVGAWIWVTGATYPHREILGSTEGGKFYFASKKKAWYFRTDEYKVRSKSNKSLEDIRNKYGSTVINSGTYKKAISK